MRSSRRKGLQLRKRLSRMRKQAASQPSAPKKRTKRRDYFNLRMCYIYAFIGLFLGSLLVYYLSPDSKVKVLACTGNYYYTDQEIYSIAGLDMDTRMFLTPSFSIRNKLEKEPLIESAEVSKVGGKITLKITEKTVIGYFVEENQNYLLTIDNEKIPVEEQYLKSIIHYPLLNGFNKKQLKAIADVFKKNSEQLTKEVIEKIAEMVPFQSTYDDNMIRMTMQDGNTIYTSLGDVVMIAKYQAMLTQLSGQSVCLLLDANNSTIMKVDCSEIVSAADAKAEQAAAEQAAQEAEQEPEEQPEEQPEEEAEPEAQPEEVPVEEEPQPESEWIYDEDMGMQYNPNTGQYMDDYGNLYVWDEYGNFVEAGA